MRVYSLPLMLFFVAMLGWSMSTQANDDDMLVNDLVPQTWQMLDYLAVDYAEAIEDGVIIDDAEYEEMLEFSATSLAFIQQLPEREGKTQLVALAQHVVELVEQKADTAVVKKQGQDLAVMLLEIYPIPTAPTQAPNLILGEQVYQLHCASCHGVSGDADGPLADALDPPAIAFTDQDRADQRSPLSLYQTVTQGVEDTSMAAYKDSLTEEERWAVAFYTGTLAYVDQQAEGAVLWKEHTLARSQVSNLEELAHLRVDQMESVIGEDEARALIGFLRANPEEIEAALTGLALARGRLQASLQAYKQQDKKVAVSLALSAYLDGVEPVEPILNSKNRQLTQRIELAMGVYRTALTRDAEVADLEEQVIRIDALLEDADELVGSSYDAPTIFLASFTILLREGLEALLIIIAMLTFLSKAQRPDAVKYVHVGWIAALVAGGLTWLAARYLIDISGASRELTEGISALFAAVMLLGVGLWMHNKSVGNRWQAYLSAKVEQALNRKSILFLFLLSFISVYREVFETILFYAALWTEGLEKWLVAGMLAAIVVLTGIAWLLVQTSRRLPIGKFFSASSALIAVLAVVLTGKGISALQEAGWVAVSLAPVPSFDLLGVYPTWQTVIAQLVMLALLVVGYLYNKRLRTA